MLHYHETDPVIVDLQHANRVWMQRRVWRFWCFADRPSQNNLSN